MRLTDDQLRALARALERTEDHELDCDEYLNRLAAYAELRALGEPVPESFAPVLAHERLCANCAEETQALIDVLRAP